MSSCGCSEGANMLGGGSIKDTNTKQHYYNIAKKLGIVGRSTMNKYELKEACRAAAAAAASRSNKKR